MCTKTAAPVILGGCESYVEPELSKSLERLLEPLGGLASFVKPGERILIKPNILAGRSAEHAVTTHPFVVAAIVRKIVSLGALALVGDSPGLESTEGAARRSGITAAVEEAGGKIVNFGPETIDLDNLSSKAFKHFEVTKVLEEVDGVINIAKIKTHGQMALTLGVKNTLGCVVGMRKAQWHLKAGSSEIFAQMLLDLHKAVAPRLTIIDGIVAMEGNGPFTGNPKHLGLLIASTNAQAADLVAANRAGFSVEEIPTLLAAGLRLEDITLETIKGAPSVITKLEPSLKFMHVGWIPFPSVRNFVRETCTPRPDFNEAKCTGCYRCMEICPAKALEPGEFSKMPKLNLTKCIRCFCCQEVCPEGAITVGSGFLRRILGRFF